MAEKKTTENNNNNKETPVVEETIEVVAVENPQGEVTEVEISEESTPTKTDTKVTSPESPEASESSDTWNDKLSDATQAASQAASEVVGNVTDSAQKAAKKFKETASQVPQNLPPEVKTAANDAPGFFKALFNFNFGESLTLRFSGAIYLVHVVAFVLMWLMLVIGFGSEGFGMGLVMLLLGWIPFVLLMVWVRLGLEALRNIATIAKNTSPDSEKSAGDN